MTPVTQGYESQMAEGKPFSYLQVSTIWTQDYQE